MKALHATDMYAKKKSGLMGTAGSALNSAVTTAREVKNAGSDRESALLGTRAVLSGVQAVQAGRLDEAGLASGSSAANNTVGLSLTYGSQKSRSQSNLEEHTHQGSTLTAGNNLSVTATGAKGNGDITIEGSELQAGKDVRIDAARDLNLVSSTDTRETRGSNSSSGGSIGVGVGVGKGTGFGLSASASINSSNGRESGNGVTHNETLVTAGNNVTLSSGRDTLLQGAQVSGEAIRADVARNLTLRSEQDADRYDMKQSSMSAGGSVTLGAGGGGSVNATRDKMHSNYDSVQEQTGLFAGKGGFDVTVGEHTQLDGAVIASTATADKNRLDTGTLGWKNIENRAEYEVEHLSAGLSTGGGSVGDQFIGNMANSMLVGINGSGDASSTTQAAVSDGSITIRDKDNQQQDVATLSRDAEHANQTLSPIFDKEKEQQRIKEAQLVAEIGMQVSDIVRTEGQIAATKAATDKMASASDADREKAKADWEKAHPGKTATADDINSQVYQNFYNEAFAETGLGTGGTVQKAIQAATAAVQGLAGGNIGQAISGAAAPYLAEVIKKSTGDNREANTMAHAVLGAVTSWASGNSALAGAAGAATAELMAPLIIASLGWDENNLSETQKQTVSALATLAAGLSGGVAGDSTADAVTGAQTGQNAVNNNYLSSKQIDDWSAEMKSCQASGGDCGGIISKYEELSTAQQKQLISDCAASPATCQQKYGDVLTDSLAVKQAIDRALGEDIPIKMVYDLTATFAQQMQAEGVVATSKVSEALQKEYGLDEVQAGIVAGVAASAFGGISKAGKGSALPTPTATTATNGLSYQSNPKHTPGQQGYSFNAGTEPKNSIDLFGSSIVSGKKRYSIDADGNVHQFTNTNDGTWHWSGSTGDKTVPIKKSDIPNSVKKEFGLPGKWR